MKVGNAARWREAVTWQCDTGHLNSASNMRRWRYTVGIHTPPFITGHQVARCSLQTDPHVAHIHSNTFTCTLSLQFIGPIPWGHSGPLCHALSLSWTSMRRRRATVPLATFGGLQWWMGPTFFKCFLFLLVFCLLSCGSLSISITARITILYCTASNMSNCNWHGHVDIQPQSFQIWTVFSPAWVLFFSQFWSLLQNDLHRSVFKYHSINLYTVIFHILLSSPYLFNFYPHSAMLAW